ncbi:MAG: hypothetical protein K6E92_10345 [Lachnospiraceae bacterium]|nr:hypothetical protein [Lachnospiraceae bacterium]
MTSEDYLDSLLRSMGVPVEITEDKGPEAAPAEMPAEASADTQDKITAVFSDLSGSEEPVVEQAEEPEEEPLEKPAEEPAEEPEFVPMPEAVTEPESVPESEILPEEIPFPEEAVMERPSYASHESDIPVVDSDPDGRGPSLVIDSAPDLTPVSEEISEEMMQSDLADIMASLRPAMEKQAAEEAEVLTQSVTDVTENRRSFPENPFVEETVEEPVLEEPVTEESVAEEPIAQESVVAEPLVEEAVVQEPEPEPKPDPASEIPADPNAKMSDDDIAALLASMNGGEEAPAEEVSIEEPVAEEPVIEEPKPEPAPAPEIPADTNAKMSDDDIAALLASMNGGEEAPAEEVPIEEPVAEEPVIEEPEPEPAPALEIPADPNAKMSDDDIAALLASMNGGEEAPAEEVPIEEPVAEEPVIEEPEPEPAPAPEIPADPNARMSDDDIAALLASMNGEAETPAEEAPVEKSAADEPGEEPTLEELAGMAVPEPDAEEEPVAEPEPLPMEEEEEESDPDYFSQEEIERMLAGAEAEGTRQESEPIGDLSLDELLERADDSAETDIGDLLEKAENNVAVDEGIEALLNAPSEEITEDMLGDGAPAPMSKEEKAAEKKRQKEEKKEAKRKAKEEKARKKAEKAASKKKGKASEPEKDMSDVDALLAGATESALAGMDAGAEPAAPAPSVEPASEAESPLDSEAEELAGLLGSEFDIASEPIPDAGSGDAEMGGSPDLDAELLATIENEGKTEKKKKGFFARILDALTEEPEEEGIQEIQLSDENAQVLEELLNEEGGKKGKKKKKKDKKKKGEPAAAEGEEGEEAEEAPKKKKKEKKPKKEKEPKPEAEKEKGKKLDKKKVLLIFAICATIGAALLLLTNLTGNYTVKKSGRDAYYQGDYQTCYQNLYGKELTETEEVMFRRSECILKIRLWMREYEILSEESEVRALDSLLQSVSAYPTLYESAVYWNCQTEVSAVYNEMVAILAQKYGITPAQAIEIAADPDDVSYTRKVTAIANGEGYQTPGSEQAPETAPQPPEPEREDVLTGEEEDLTNGQETTFVEP